MELETAPETACYRADLVVTPDSYETFEDFTRQTLEERIESLPEIFEDVAAK